MVTENGFEFWNAFADGYEGYMAAGGSYAGGGHYQTKAQRSKSRADRERGSRGKPTKPNLKKPSKAEQVRNKQIAADSPLSNLAEDEYGDLDPPQSLEPGPLTDWARRMANLLERKVKIIGFEEKQITKIRQAVIDFFASNDCSDAFRRAGRSTVPEIVRDRGIVFVHYTALQFTANNSRIGITEPERSRLWNRVNIYAQATTVDWVGKPVIVVLKNSAFAGTPFEFGEVMPHEMVHGAGVPSTYAWYQFLFGFIGHDLNGYRHYEDILTNCRLSTR